MFEYFLLWIAYEEYGLFIFCTEFVVCISELSIVLVQVVGVSAKLV